MAEEEWLQEDLASHPGEGCATRLWDKEEGEVRDGKNRSRACFGNQANGTDSHNRRGKERQDLGLNNWVNGDSLMS